MSESKVLLWYWRHLALELDEEDSVNDASRQAWYVEEDGHGVMECVEVWDDDGHRVLERSAFIEQWRVWTRETDETNNRLPKMVAAVDITLPPMPDRRVVTAGPAAALHSAFYNREDAEARAEQLRAVMGEDRVRVRDLR